MSSDKVFAQLAEIRSLSQSMTTRASNTQSDFNSLKTRLSALSSAFQGQTATAFEQKYEQWNTAATDLVTALTDLGTFLSQAATAIEDTDTQLAQGLQG